MRKVNNKVLTPAEKYKKLTGTKLPFETRKVRSKTGLTKQEKHKGITRGVMPVKR